MALTLCVTYHIFLMQRYQKESQEEIKIATRQYVRKGSQNFRAPTSRPLEEEKEDRRQRDKKLPFSSPLQSRWSRSP